MQQIQSKKKTWIASVYIALENFLFFLILNLYLRVYKFYRQEALIGDTKTYTFHFLLRSNRTTGQLR